MLVVTATLAEAERMAVDLSAYLDRPGPRPAAVGDLSHPVVLLPPWETLPFERVSPDTATMGRRLAILWHLFGDAGAGPAVVVAPVRAVLQRLPPWRQAAAPLVVERGGALDADQFIEQLVLAGYRREHQVEHRGELAVRGGILDVFPSTAEVPVRIDLFGDEVDRLTAFDVADQRSVADLDRVVLFGCRELRQSPELAARAAELVDAEPWGRSQWERLAQGQSFDGMESWLPWLHPDEEILTDLLSSDAQVVLVEPRRIRDRAVELFEEEGALGGTLAATWGVEGAGHGDSPLPRLHLAFDRLLVGHRGPGAVAHLGGRGPRRGRGGRPGLRAGGRGRRSAGRPGHGPGGPGLLGHPVRGHRERGPPTGRGAGRRGGVGQRGPGRPTRGPGSRVVVAPISSGFVLPDLGLAVLAESDITGRRTPHRTARPRARPTDGFFDDLAPGSYVVHRQHGVARYAGVTTRTIAGTARDYLVLEYRGSDRLYLPVDQIEAVTPYSGGETPTLSKMGGAEWQRTRARARAAAGEVAEELVELYRRRLAVPGRAFSPDTPWQHELESSFPYTETPDQLRAIAEVKADMELPRPMDRLVCGDVGFGKTEVALRAVFKAVQDGTQAAVLVPTTLLASQHAQTFADRFAGYPVRVELLSRFLSGAQARQVVDGLAEGSVDVVIGTHRLLGQDIALQAAGPAGGRRGAALRGLAQGVGQAHVRGGRRADPDGQPHPPDPGDGPDRHPGPLHGQHAAVGPPAHLDLRGRVRRGGGVRGRPPGAAPGGPGLLRPQPGVGHRRRGPPAGGAGARGPGGGGPRPDGRGQPGADRPRLLGAPVRPAGVHHHHRVGHRHALGQHLGGGPGRPARAWASSTRSGAGWAGPTSGPTPTSSIRPTGC